MKLSLLKYIKRIKETQSTLVIASVGFFLLVLPTTLAFIPESLPQNLQTLLYMISFTAVTFVMAIRPLADIFPKIILMRPLVVLRKGFGILSSSIIVSFILFKIITFGPEYLYDFFSVSYWRFYNYTFFAHLGDVTAVILLITSNTFSKKILGKNWKRIQKLAYVYFYSGGIYEFFVFHNKFALYSMIVVTFLVLIAYLINSFNKKLTKMSL